MRDMSDVVIRVENLSKRYRIGLKDEIHKTLVGAVADFATRPIKNLRKLRGLSTFRDGEQESEDIIWALDDVSLEIKEGEKLGIIGNNGAGKSTLLKIMSHITEPTDGRVLIKGRVSSLLEVGTGFHQELTGRENVYLNGTVLGMSRREIDGKFDEIVDFSGVERFIDTPVKRYSSGMQVRLAFAVAAHLEPEILLIDEVLAVGDAEFQKKCLGKMEDMAIGGRTIVFVSHNMGAISELCDRAIFLNEGRQMADGPVTDVIGAYAGLATRNGDRLDLQMDQSLPCAIVGLELCNGQGIATTSFDIDDTIVITVAYKVTAFLRGLQITATLRRGIVDVTHSFDTDELPDIPPREPGQYQAVYTIPRMFLKAGLYSARITAGTPERLIQDLESALGFEVEERSVNTHMKGYRMDRIGQVISPGSWRTTKTE